MSRDFSPYLFLLFFNVTVHLCHKHPRVFPVRPRRRDSWEKNDEILCHCHAMLMVKLKFKTTAGWSYSKNFFQLSCWKMRIQLIIQWKINWLYNLFSNLRKTLSLSLLLSRKWMKLVDWRVVHLCRLKMTLLTILYMADFFSPKCEMVSPWRVP